MTWALGSSGTISMAMSSYSVNVLLGYCTYHTVRSDYLIVALFTIMLRSLPLENTVNTSSQLENSVRHHFQVVFTSGELGSFKASPFVPLGVLDLVSSFFGPKYAENSI